MTKRSYRQYCGLAQALDLVGERWTLLIVRDLWLGARRYSDLAEGLPGIGAGLLAQRLRDLEANGVVRRVFAPAPVGAVVYELTPDGEELAEALVPLAAWGIQRLTDVRDDDGSLRPDHVAFALRTRFDPTRAAGVHDTYEIRVDDEPYTITADDGTISVERGPARDAAAVIAMDSRTMMEIGIGRLTLDAAVASGRLVQRGSRRALARCAAMLRLPAGRRGAGVTSG